MSTGFDLQSIAELKGKPSLCTSPAVFTSGESAHCRSRADPVESLAGVIAAKEAFIKAVGIFAGVPRFSFTDMEVAHQSTGRPRLLLHGRLGAWCAGYRLQTDLSISHSGDMAGAVVVLLSRGD